VKQTTELDDSRKIISSQSLELEKMKLSLSQATHTIETMTSERQLKENTLLTEKDQLTQALSNSESSIRDLTSRSEASHTMITSQSLELEKMR
jgi:hypothetical protein